MEDSAIMQHFASDERHAALDEKRDEKIHAILTEIKDEQLSPMKAQMATQGADIGWIKQGFKDRFKVEVSVLLILAGLFLTSIYRVIAKQ